MHCLIKTRKIGLNSLLLEVNLVAMVLVDYQAKMGEMGNKVQPVYSDRGAKSVLAVLKVRMANKVRLVRLV